MWMTSRREFLGGLLAAGGSVVLPGCGGPVEDPHAPPGVDAGPTFPRFYWGVGIENTWMAQADPVKDGGRQAFDEFELTQHYDRWHDDLDLAAELGVVAMRYSVPWYRAEASPAVYDFSWLDGPIDRLNELGIEPILDLIHYGTPTWMADGIGDERFPEALADYGAATADHFRGRVRHYTPHNEPQLSAALCGASAAWPPYKNTRGDWCVLGLRIARAMVLTTQSLRATLPGVRIVSADPINWLLSDTVFSLAGLTSAELEDLRAAVGSFPASVAYGKVGPEHRLGKYLIEATISPDELTWFQQNAAPPDLLGYNHYPDVGDYPGSADYTESGKLPLAEAAAGAAKHVETGLRRAQAYFDLPVYLSETSAGLTPSARSAYATAIHDMVVRLRAAEFPLVGVNWWPLFEAVQWLYRDQPTLPLGQFIVPGAWNNGLYDLRLETDGSLTRVKNEAAATYRDIILKDRAGG